MNRTWILLTLLFTLLTTACQPIRPVADVQATPLAEEEAFTQAAMGLEEAYQQADLDRTIDFYADNAISQPPGYRTDVGKEAIKSSYQAFFDAYVGFQKINGDWKVVWEIWNTYEPAPQ